MRRRSNTPSYMTPLVIALLWLGIPLSQAFLLVAVPLPGLPRITGDRLQFESGTPRSWHGTTLDMSSKSRDTSEIGELETEVPSNTRRFSGMRLGLVVDDNKLGEAVALSKRQSNRTKSDFETKATSNVGLKDDSVREFKVGKSKSSLTNPPPSPVLPTFVFQDIVFGLFTIMIMSLAFGKSTPAFFYDTLLMSAPQYVHTLWLLQGIALTALSIGSISAVSQGGMAKRTNNEQWVGAVKGFLGGPWATLPLRDKE